MAIRRCRPSPKSCPASRSRPAWFSFLGPAWLPKLVLERLHGEIVTALHAPDVEKWLDTNSLQLFASTRQVNHQLAP